MTSYFIWDSSDSDPFELTEIKTLDTSKVSVTYRRLETADRMPVYRVFRKSLWDFMLQSGIVGEDDSYDIGESFERQGPLLMHLEKTAAEDWIAVDAQDRPVGWARSVERGEHLQLTHFFVDPSLQGNGIGRALLDLAFPRNRGRLRSIIATTNNRALTLYLRYGVGVQGMAFSMYGQPEKRPVQSDLEVEQAQNSEDTLRSIANIDGLTVGYNREVDLAFFMKTQPSLLFRRQGNVVAYAFGSNGDSVGPAGVLESADLPTVLQHIESGAAELGQKRLYLTIPAQARHAVDWALRSGYKIDTFYEVLLTDSPWIHLDRYVMTDCSFIW